MSGCNQCLKVPCECMDNPAELLRSEFPGWNFNIDGVGDAILWPGDGPQPDHTDGFAVVSGRDRVGFAAWPLGTAPCKTGFPTLLTAAEHATGETRLSRRPKPETGTARIVSWAEDIRRWREQGRAPAGSCPFCASRISVVERDGVFVARCSHRGCGARGPKHHDLTRACDLFCCPPQRKVTP